MRRRSLVSVAFMMAGAFVCTSARATRLDTERRVDACRAVERVLWERRIWPESNPGPKPPLESVLPESVLRAQVEDVLRKSEALETIWHRPIGDRELQAEIDRMVRGSRAPDTLEAMFDALGRDPVLIGEAVARPALVDRLIRSWYANDPRFHETERRRAERDLSAASSVDDLARIAPRYRVTTWTQDVEAGRPAVRPAGTIAVDASRWSDLRAKLGGRPAGQIGRLEETETAYTAAVVLSKGDRTLEVGVASWPKTTFESWWSVERDSHRAALPDLGSNEPALSIPAASRSIGTPICVDDSWIKTGTGAPLGRAWHAAVWTGTEMIVWGGLVQSGFGISNDSRSGGRYDPATDTWSTISTIDSPDSGESPAAVWTGSRMIIWGGSDGGSTFYRSGGVYDPVTDRWTPTTLANAPSARIPEVAVWTGSRMVIWGDAYAASAPGSGGTYDPLNDTWTATTLTDAPFTEAGQNAVWSGSEMIVWPGKRYDPAADVWRPISSTGAPAHRDFAALAWIGSRMIAWGGTAFGQYLGDGGLYDPATDSWSAMTATNAPQGRAGAPSAWVANRFVVWGGENGANTGGRYDPATNTWTATTTVGAPDARVNASAVVAGNEMIVWGGWASSDMVNTGARYNPLDDTWVPTRIGNASPQARSQHSAVWTGVEMIVWGGSGYDDILADGGAYAPATDSWVPTSPVAAPSQRVGPVAVWTGASMLVWSGLDYNGPLNTGGRYDPIAHSWSAITTSGAPSAREVPSVVWTGTRMIVWGGYDGNLTLFDGGRYDPSGDSWLPVSGSGAPYPRVLHTAVWTGSSMIVWGGEATGNVSLSSGGRYDPSTDSWTATTTTSAPSARYGHTAVWTGDRMLLWGGQDSAPLGDGSSYDPVANAWTPLSSAGAPAARFRPSAIWTGNEMIVWGGYDGTDTLNSGGRYRPADGTWRSTSPSGAPDKRITQTAVWTGSKMLIWGGSRSDFYPADVYNDGASYCSCVNWYPDADGDGYGASGGVISVCDGTHPAGTVVRGGDCNDGNAAIHPGVADATCDGVDDDCDGQIDEDYIAQPIVCGYGPCRAFGNRDCVGGQYVYDCVPGTPSTTIDDTCNNVDDDCDGVVDDDFPQHDDYWTATANAPASRTNHTAVWSGSEVLVFGGDNGSGTVQTGGVAYAPATNAWRTLATGPAKRWHHTATWTGSRMVVWGGDDNVSTIYNSGSRYDPGTDTWAASTTTGAPTARGLHSAVWTGSRVVIWGGRDAANYLNTGSRYDPAANSWSATSTTGAPAVRDAHTAVWTGSEMLVWGGLSTGQVSLNTGGRYNPASNTWSSMTTTGAPSARYGHVAVWTGTEMLIWGGTSNGTSYLADGARYNPATDTWTSIPNLGAPTRRAFASYVWTGTELIVWGGTYKTNEVPETPLADGARYNPSTNAWTAMNTQLALPSARARAASVWTGSELIVWGGDPDGGAVASGGRYNPRTVCGVGACQQVGLTYCSGGTTGFQCTPLAPTPEVCDNVDNDCNGTIDDGIAPPTSRPAVLAAKSGGIMSLSWTAASDATGYDTVRGSLGTLRSSAGNFATSVDLCIANDQRGASSTDSAAPPAGSGYWYLVRPVNACSGSGSYDEPIPPQQGLRDAEIAASGLACP